MLKPGQIHVTSRSEPRHDATSSPQIRVTPARLRNQTQRETRDHVGNKGDLTDRTNHYGGIPHIARSERKYATNSEEISRLEGKQSRVK